MRLFAISDLHVRYPDNAQFLAAIPPCPEDWLILGGDLGETEEDLHLVLRTLAPRFQKLLWIPGNHELWTMPTEPSGLRGVAKYERLVAVCREYGALTPEDPYVVWPGDGPKTALCPLFVLYDYTFRPDEIPDERALEWAAEAELSATDEVLLHADPYPSKVAWCHARVKASEERLSALDPTLRTVLINHYPLRREHAWLPRIPRFSIWCGTRLTEDWAGRFRARAVVYGHLHMRGTAWNQGVRYEEVSLGYPRQWQRGASPLRYMREILPGTEIPGGDGERTYYR